MFVSFTSIRKYKDHFSFLRDAKFIRELENDSVDSDIIDEELSALRQSASIGSVARCCISKYRYCISELHKILYVARCKPTVDPIGIRAAVLLSGSSKLSVRTVNV